MEKDMIKREKPQNHVLYEQPEPLFGNAGSSLRRIKIRKMAACAMLAIAVGCVGIWAAVTASGAFGGFGGNGDVDGGSQSDSTALGDGENSSESSPEESEESVSVDSDTDTLTGSGESVGGEESKETEEVSDDKGESDALESTSEGEQTLPDEPYRVDISESERGDKYILNYTSKEPNIEGLLDRGFVYSEAKYSKAPLVMIIHTHTSEQYTDGGETYYGIGGVVGVGDRITTVLNARGLTAIHCTVIHDGGEQNAYFAARETIKTMLEIYPSIKYVIDVHAMRLEDQNGELQSTVLTSNGAAQVKLTVGTDIKREGVWQDDLSLALEIRSHLNRDGEKACAPVVVTHGGYNADLCRFYIMLDVGTIENSTREAITAGESFAKALADTVLY